MKRAQFQVDKAGHPQGGTQGGEGEEEGAESCGDGDAGALVEALDLDVTLQRFQLCKAVKD